MAMQYLTLWDGGDCTKAVRDVRTRKLLDLARPQGVQLHARGATLARVGPKLTEELKAAYPGLEVMFAIAGDFDDKRIPGYSDGWEEAARAAVSCGASALVLNCEPAWKTRPAGSARQAVAETHAAAPTLPLWHTSYGAPSYHKDYPWAEFLGDASPIVASAFQVYFARADGENKARGFGLTWTERYAASIRWAQKHGMIGASKQIHGYLQAYDSRVDELCACADSYPVCSWWTAPNRLDDAGITAIRVMSELHRRGMSIDEFQRSAGLVVDGLVGRKTLAALGIV